MKGIIVTFFRRQFHFTVATFDYEEESIENEQIIDETNQNKERNRLRLK